MAIDLRQRDVFDVTIDPANDDLIVTNIYEPIAVLDVYFLIDVTQSMRDAITGVKFTIGRIIERLHISVLPGVDVRYGVGIYCDFTDDCGVAGGFRCFNHLLDPIFPGNAEGNRNATIFAINSIGTGGGGDRPECQIYALSAIASPADPAASVRWRPGAKRVVAWVGDAPGHDPSGGVTTIEAMIRLRNAGISVSGLSIGGNGLNDPL